MSKMNNLINISLVEFLVVDVLESLRDHLQNLSLLNDLLFSQHADTPHKVTFLQNLILLQVLKNCLFKLSCCEEFFEHDDCLLSHHIIILVEVLFCSYIIMLKIAFDFGGSHL